MRSENNGRNKNTPTNTSTADRADGRDTAESSSTSENDSRDTASRQRGVQIGDAPRSRTDGPQADNADDDAVEACPECDSSHIRGLVHNGWGSPAGDHEYYCNECYTGFDEPVVRERQDVSGLQGLPRQLADMDPDELLQGGGEA